jgi:hypothetical protein
MSGGTAKPSVPVMCRIMSVSKPASDVFVGIRSPHQVPVKQTPFNIAFTISVLQTRSPESSKSIKYPSSTSASAKHCTAIT